jgi:hypothetical protein
MPHTVESTINYSDRDRARGAIDLLPEGDAVPVNGTLLETAVSVIKEAGPNIIEIITSHLMPVIPRHSGAAGQPAAGTEVVVSPPIGTIIVMPPPVNSSHLDVPVVRDTVCVMLGLMFLITHYLYVSKFSALVR